MINHSTVCVNVKISMRCWETIEIINWCVIGPKTQMSAITVNANLQWTWPRSSRLKLI